MNLHLVQAFMNKLNLDIAVEQVGSNETIPARWNHDVQHFRGVLFRPGVQEVQFPFSIGPYGAGRPSSMTWVLFCVAQAMWLYEQYPTASAWCAATGAILDDIVDVFSTFEGERTSLVRFFGEHYADFLSLGED